MLGISCLVLLLVYHRRAKHVVVFALGLFKSQIFFVHEEARSSLNALLSITAIGLLPRPHHYEIVFLHYLAQSSPRNSTFARGGEMEPPATDLGRFAKMPPEIVRGLLEVR